MIRKIVYKWEIKGALVIKFYFHPQLTSLFHSWMQCVMLLSQIKVNSMAIVRMKSLVVNEKVKQSGMLSSAGDALTSNVEQVMRYT